MNNMNGRHVSLITMTAPDMLSKYDLLTHIDQCLLPPPAACGWVSSYPGNWPPPPPLESNITFFNQRRSVGPPLSNVTFFDQTAQMGLRIIESE